MKGREGIFLLALLSLLSSRQLKCHRVSWFESKVAQLCAHHGRCVKTCEDFCVSLALDKKATRFSFGQLWSPTATYSNRSGVERAVKKEGKGRRRRRTKGKKRKETKKRVERKREIRKNASKRPQRHSWVHFSGAIYLKTHFTTSATRVELCFEPIRLNGFVTEDR